MAHQMKTLCGFSVFHCLKGAFGASSRGAPKMKRGEVFLLTGGALLLTVKLLCLQSLKALIRRTFPL